MLSPRFSVRPFSTDDAERVTTLWRESMSAAIGIESIHSFESQLYFLTQVLPQHYTVLVAVDDMVDIPIAFTAYSPTEVNQLYVDVMYQGQGIGAALIQLALRDSSGSLQLRTFEVNQKAQRFYERYGFVAIGGDSNNEEGLPDILYEWRRCEA